MPVRIIRAYKSLVLLGNFVNHKRANVHRKFLAKSIAPVLPEPFVKEVFVVLQVVIYKPVLRKPCAAKDNVLSIPAKHRTVRKINTAPEMVCAVGLVGVQKANDVDHKGVKSIFVLECNAVPNKSVYKVFVKTNARIKHVAIIGSVFLGLDVLTIRVLVLPVPMEQPAVTVRVWISVWNNPAPTA